MTPEATTHEEKSSRSYGGFVLWLVASILLLTGCTLPYAKFGHPEVRVDRDLRSIKAEPDPLATNTLVVSGGIPHSSWGISDMAVRRENDVILIKMHMRHAGFGRTNLTDRFSYRVEVPPDVNFVKIGKEKETIWSRGVR